MDISVALSVLHLNAVPPSGELKRAYLRAVRRHSPERDPEGFMRVRAAYELLLKVDEGTPNNGTAQADLGSTKQIDTPATPDTSPPFTFAIPSFVSAIDDNALPIETPADTLLQFDRKDGAFAILRSSTELGNEEDQFRLLTQFREEVTEQDLVRAMGSHSHRVQETVARFYWDQGRVPDVARVLMRIYDDRDPSDTFPPSPELCLKVVLQSYANRKQATATKLLGIFEHWLERQVDSRSVLGAATPFWLVAREIRDLRSVVSSEIRQILADAVLKSETDALAASLKLRHNHMSARELERFSEAAPTLYQFAQSYLWRTRSRTSFKRRSAVSVWLVVPLVFSLLGGLSNLGLRSSNSRTQAFTQKSGQEQSPGLVTQGSSTGASPTTEQSAQESSDSDGMGSNPEDSAFMRLTTVAKDKGYFRLVARSTELHRQAQSNACNITSQQLDEYAQNASVIVRASPELEEPLDSFFSFIHRHCPSLVHR